MHAAHELINMSGLHGGAPPLLVGCLVLVPPPPRQPQVQVATVLAVGAPRLGGSPVFMPAAIKDRDHGVLHCWSPIPIPP